MKKILLWITTISLLGSIFLGFWQFSKKETMKRDLNLDGLFVNIKGVDVKTENSSIFDEKPYDKIVIKIPSLASENDDSLIDGKKVNKLIDRENFDKYFKTWLKHIFSKETARKYANQIVVYYRDDKIIQYSESEK